MRGGTCTGGLSKTAGGRAADSGSGSGGWRGAGITCSTAGGSDGRDGTQIELAHRLNATLALFVDGPCVGESRYLEDNAVTVTFAQFDGFDADGHTRSKNITYYRADSPHDGFWAYSLVPPTRGCL